MKPTQTYVTILEGMATKEDRLNALYQWIKLGKISCRNFKLCIEHFCVEGWD